MADQQVKILVIGDSGVGKSSLVQFLKYLTVNKKFTTPNPTIGCNIEVLIHNNLPVELWDISGSSAHPSYSQTRNVFYDNVNGLILVHDMNNIKSLNNLRTWLKEVRFNFSAPLTSVGTYDMEADERLLPSILIGTKLDSISEHKLTTIQQRIHRFAVDLRAEQLNLDVMSKEKISIESQQKLSSFFDAAVQHSKSTGHNLSGNFSSFTTREETTRHRAKGVGVKID